MLLCALGLHVACTRALFAVSMHAKASATNTGLASWYGRGHDGKVMANGEPFDSSRLTAASRTLPLGSWVRVFNLRNGKAVDVQITDRGPSERLSDRILDVSEAAARQLGFHREGLALVAFLPVASKALQPYPKQSSLRISTTAHGDAPPMNLLSWCGKLAVMISPPNP